MDRVAVITLYTRDRRVAGHLLVDEADRKWVDQWVWYFSGGYARRRAHTGEAGPKNIYLHRAMLGLEMGDPRQVDHINRDRRDCRRANLRIVEPGQNRQNTPSLGGSSRYRGVTWNSSKGKWQAQAQLNGRRHHLGRFDSEEEAAAAASAWRRENMPWSEDAA